MKVWIALIAVTQWMGGQSTTYVESHAFSTSEKCAAFLDARGPKIVIYNNMFNEPADERAVEDAVPNVCQELIVDDAPAR